MRWTKTFGHTASRVIFAFGLLIVISTIVSGRRQPDEVFPGLIVGAAWTIAGWKRGLPIIPTSKERPAALNQIRRRGRILLASIAVFLALGGLVLPALPERALFTGFVLVAMVAALPFCILALSECPYCHEQIAAGWGRFGSVLLFSRCGRCGETLRHTVASGPR